jgi:MFS family permease
MAASLHRERDAALLVGAVGISSLGDWLAITPLLLMLQSMTGSGFQVALLFMALWAPSVLLAAPAGILVDSVDRRLLLVWVSLAQAAVVAVLAFVDSNVGILALVTLLGIGIAVSSPAEFTLAPAITEPERLAQLNGWIETARAAGFTLGPVAGGALAAAGGTRVALLIDAATFVLVGIAALLLRPRYAQSVATDADHADAQERWYHGVVVLFADRVTGLVLAVGFASLLFMTASITAEVFFAKDVLHTSDTGFGAMYTTWALGMAIGGLLLARRFSVALAGGALVAIVVQSLAVGLPTLWLSLTFTLGCYLIGGAAHGLKNVLIRTLLQQRVPGRLHGRVFAAWNGLRNGAELVALLCGGALVSLLGARVTLFIAGAVPAVAGLIGLALYARLRHQSPAMSSPASAESL